MIINTGRKGRGQGDLHFTNRWRLPHYNIPSLDEKRWLSSEVLDGAFDFMSRKLKCVESLSYITMKPYATESFNSKYLKETLSEHTNILIIPIFEKHHWFSIVT